MERKICGQLESSPALWVNKSDTSALNTELLGCMYILVIVKESSSNHGQPLFSDFKGWWRLARPWQTFKAWLFFHKITAYNS